MALLADGLHMASHAVELTINAFAYIYARHHAQDIKYSFGTGKVNALGGFTGAVLLAIFALMMIWESVERIIYPVGIAYNPAIFVAILGLIINGTSVFILGHHDDHAVGDHDHHHDHDHNLRAASWATITIMLTETMTTITIITFEPHTFTSWPMPLPRS